MKKRAYYIHGFDHRGVSGYYSLFKKLASKNIDISQLNGNGFIINGEVELVILCWQKYVKKYWHKSFKLFFIAIIFYLKFFLLTPSRYLFIKKHAPKLAIAIILPVAVLVGSLLTAFLFSSVIPRFFWVIPGLGSLAIGWYICNKLKLGWLIRANCFVDTHLSLILMNIISGYFVEMIRKYENKCPAAEVMLIGHSVGSLFLLSTIKKLISEKIILLPYKPITVLSLGSLIPYLYLTCKQQLHEDLLWLAQNDIEWHDFSSRADALCFFQTNPYTLFKIKFSNIYFHDLKFASLFKSRHWSKIRRNKIYVHFLYFKQYKDQTQYNFFNAICADDTSQYLSNLPSLKA